MPTQNPFGNVFLLGVGGATFQTMANDAATGDLYYLNANRELVRLPVGTTGRVLSSNGTVPVWSAVGTMSAQNASAVAITGGSATGLSQVTLTSSTRTMTFLPQDGGNNIMFEFRNPTGVIYQDWALDATTDYHARFIINSTSTFTFDGLSPLTYNFARPVSVGANQFSASNVNITGGTIAGTTDISATRLTSGTIPDARLSTRLNAIAVATNPATAKLTQLNTDGTISFVDPPIGGGGGETNTASNVGVGGIGVFKQKTGVNLEFRNITAASNKVSVALDAANNEIDVDINEANLSIGTSQITSFATTVDTRADNRITAAIGTSVQGFDADLSAIAGLTTESYGRSLLTMANESALNQDLFGGNELIVSTTLPTTRQDGSALVAGDLWIGLPNEIFRWTTGMSGDIASGWIGSIREFTFGLGSVTVAANNHTISGTRLMPHDSTGMLIRDVSYLMRCGTTAHTATDYMELSLIRNAVSTNAISATNTGVASPTLATVANTTANTLSLGASAGKFQRVFSNTTISTNAGNISTFGLRVRRVGATTGTFAVEVSVRVTYRFVV